MIGYGILFFLASDFVDVFFSLVVIQSLYQLPMAAKLSAVNVACHICMNIEYFVSCLVSGCVRVGVFKVSSFKLSPLHAFSLPTFSSVCACLSIQCGFFLFMLIAL